MKIDQKEVESFLAEKFSQDINKITLLAGGKHSEAFSYSTTNGEYVIRFNETDFGFKKDSYAYDHFREYVLIPKILEIGSYKDRYFCISEKVSGHSVRDEYKEGDFSSLELQFKAIEEIAKIVPPENSKGFGEWDPETLNAAHGSLEESITSIYESKTYFDWESLGKVEGFDVSFVEYLKDKIKDLLPYSKGLREMRHGDFGNENVLLKDNAIQGVIDWHKATYDDHLFDVGRVVLYCPSRDETSKTALRFYEKSTHKNYRERILLGVYITMLTNYGFASRAGNIDSLKSSHSRIGEIEKYFI